VDYEGYTADKLTIKRDKMKPAEFDKFLRGTLIREFVFPGCDKTRNFEKKLPYAP
jgi:hypothetical protein